MTSSTTHSNTFSEPTDNDHLNKMREELDYIMAGCTVTEPRKNVLFGVDVRSGTVHSACLIGAYYVGKYGTNYSNIPLKKEMPLLATVFSRHYNLCIFAFNDSEGRDETVKLLKQLVDSFDD